MCEATVKNDRSRRKVVEKIENNVRCWLKREEAAADGRAAARLTCKEKASIEDDGKRWWLLKIGGKGGIFASVRVGTRANLKNRLFSEEPNTSQEERLLKNQEESPDSTGRKSGR